MNTESVSDTLSGWTKVHRNNAGGGASVNSWSSAQSIGFPFSFYGSPATHFCVSKNYLLTFDTTVAGTTVNSSITTDNTALPNANLPDHTIAYFWGAFTPPLEGGSNVWMKIFGTAPNRQFWIKNYHYKYEDQPWSENFVVLEETTHKIYVVSGRWRHSIKGSYTVGVQLDATMASQHPQSPNISAINGMPVPSSSVASIAKYYEFTPFTRINDDAGIVSLDNPISPVASGSQSIQVSIKNYGLNNLDSVRVNWSADGVAQAPYSWLGNLASDAVAVAVNIGSYNFATVASTLKIWISNPNGNPDNNTSNDTLEVSLFVCRLLSGAYTLGGPAGSNNFPDFGSLAAVLNSCGGIAGPLKINIAPGTYTENFVLRNISGVSQANTITIDGGDTSLVTLAQDSLTHNITVVFDSISHVTLKNITIKNIQNVEITWGVHLERTNHIVIDSCLIKRPVSAEFSMGSIIGATTYIDQKPIIPNNHLTISNNTIMGGSYGVALLVGGDTNNRNLSNHILHNRFSDINLIGMLMRDADSLIISDNVIENTNSSVAYDIYCLNIMDFEITANNLFDCGDEGIVISGGSSSGTARSLIANNMVYAPDAAIRMTGNNSNVNIYHNTAVGLPAMEFTGNSNSDMSFYNNIFSNPSGVALDASSSLPSTIDIDYNLYHYQASGNIARDSSSYSSLAAWQAAKPALNAHSVEGDPVFVREWPPANLHVLDSLANDTGDNSVGIYVDIDGDRRPLPPSTKVDIGADEYHPATCLPSSGLSTSAIGQTTAQLSWTMGGASNWNLEYGKAGFTPGTGNFLYNVSNPHILSGLSPNTDYEFYVQDSCGVDTVSRWAGPVFFGTSCAPFTLAATLPIVEDFESASGTYQRNQNVLCYPTYKWRYTTSVAKDGRLRFAVSGFANNGSSAATLDRVSSGGTVTNYLILTADLSSYSSSSALELEFSYMHHGEENHPNDRVWIQGSNTDSWVQIYDLHANQGTGGIYNQVIGLDIDSILANATPPQRVSSTFQVRFGQEDNLSATSPTGTDGYSFDDIAIRETCPSPTKLTATNITQTNATLSWVAGGASNWDLEYGLSGFTPGRGTQIHTTIPSYTVSGLTPGMAYDFYVRSSCGLGHASSWAGPNAFTTLSATLPCPAPSSLLATQITQTSARLSWVTGGAAKWNLEWGIVNFALGSGNFLPNVAPTHYTLSGLIPGTSYQFYVRDSCGISHVSSWAGPHVFTTLSATLPCPVPSSLLASNITQTSATLSWIMGGASNWDVEYGLSGFTLGSGTRISTTTPSYAVSGLAPGTDYDFYVRDSCGVGYVSSWAGLYTFTTLSATLPCPAPSLLGTSNITQTNARLWWMSGGTSTSNWDLEYGLSGFTLGQGTRISTTTPSYTVSGLTSGTDYDFYVRDNCGIGHVSSWAGPHTFTTLSAILPCPAPSSLGTSNITQTTARLWWMSGGTSTSNWDLEYGLSGFTLGQGTRISTTTPSYTVSGLTPGTDYDFYVRDNCGIGHVSSWAGPHTFTTLSAILPCPAPSSLGASNITQTNARLSWMSGGISISNNWDVEYGLSGFTLGSGIRISTTISFYTVSGLTSGQSYQFYVRDSCGVGHVSSWAGPHTFRTLGCLAPTGLNLHTITEITATVSWTSGGASNWNIEYGPINFPLGGGIFLYNVSSPRTLRGLKPNTFYDVYVQDSCNVSNWTGPLSIKTIIGIDELLERSFRIYPNPSEGVFKLEFSSSLGEDMEIRITNMMGQIVLEDEIESFSGSYRKRLEMGAYGSGVYLLQLITERATVNRRIILQ